MTSGVVLKPGREKPVLNRHPWVYSGAIRQVSGDPENGEILPVRDSQGQFLAWGYFNGHSQIALRLCSWDPDERIDTGFWRRRLARAWLGRKGLEGKSSTTAYRLVNAESDGLPGLIVDRYGSWLVVQFLTMGMETRRDEMTLLLDELAPDAVGIYERSDVDVRKKEGLSPRVGPLRGSTPPPEVIIYENGLEFAVDLVTGHKTGFYLDQRESRLTLEKYAAGSEMLNCFAYSGAFAVYAARGGAKKVTNVESSAEALRTAQRNMVLNGYADREAEYIEADVFQQLRRYRDARRQFDLVVLDPPKFAHSQRGVNRAARGYKDINWLAMRLLRPGGTLFSFSCSGSISAELFQKILFGAALDAGRDVQIIGSLTQGPDHPILLTFPESAYLKGVICRVM